MIKYFEGTVFNTGAMAIINTVNCDGFMGAGLALEFALRYPDMFKDYKIKCQNKQIKTGEIDYYKENNIMIINFPTKKLFQFPSNITWIIQGLQKFRETYKENNITSVAFPKLGCSNGGLDWKDVNIEMEKYLSDLDIDIYICLDTLKHAEGIEKHMINALNQTNILDLSKQIKLTQKQITILEQNKPYNRFWKISKLPLIGKKTYEKLFKYFYNNNYTQIKLF